MTTQLRHPKGTPSGGRFAPQTVPASRTNLIDPPEILWSRPDVADGDITHADVEALVEGYDASLADGTPAHRYRAQRVRIADITDGDGHPMDADLRAGDAENSEDDSYVDDLAADMRLGDIFPPVVVAEEDDGTLTWLDGRHRMDAARRNGADTVMAMVRFEPGRLDPEAAAAAELAAVRELAATYPGDVTGLDTPEGSLYRSYETTRAFVVWARGQGARADQIQLYGQQDTGTVMHPPWHEVDPTHLSHHVARVGDVAVDFTARQLDAAADFPEVRPWAEKAAAWRETLVYDDTGWM